RDLLRIRGEIRRLIDKVPFFQQIVSKEFIQDMSLFLEIKDYMSEQWIFRQGEMGDAMYFLTRGKVEVVREDTGKVIDTLNEGAYFGELAVLRASARAASIRALGDCEVLELKRAGVRELAQKYPLFDHHINEACKHYAEI
ncbi:cyclic nucleotide-binding domain-containing protein, partial [Verrucomicrobiales bacterium]|nr:cyclic nucleotide-binding domain-containing protein [Verrucomicrobiales bacterium]